LFSGQTWIPDLFVEIKGSFFYVLQKLLKELNHLPSSDECDDELEVAYKRDFLNSFKEL